MTKDFDKLKLPPGLVESLKSRLGLPHLHEFFKQFGRENEKLVTAMRDAEQQQLRRVPVPKRKRLTNKFVVLCDVLRTLFPPHGRVPASIGVRELHRMVTPQLWREAWLRLIKTSPPEVPGRGAVDAARRFLLNLPGATHAPRNLPRPVRASRRPQRRPRLSPSLSPIRGVACGLAGRTRYRLVAD